MSPQSPVETPPAAAVAQEWRFRLLLLALSLGFVFLCGEIALRVLASGKPKPVASESGFTFFNHHPRLGWDLVPNATDRHKTAEFDVEIRIDARGLRSPRESAVAESAGAESESTRDGDVLRLTALGDSFTFGHGVEAREAWPAMLEAELGGVASSNLAVTGYGTDQQLLRFEERMTELRPDVVVLGLFAGNVFRNARFEQLGYAKPRFVEGREGLELRGVPVPETPPSPPASRLLGLVGRTAGGVLGHLGYGEAWTVTGGIIDRLATRCEEQGATLHVVILPKDQMVYGGGPRKKIHERMHRRLHGLLEERGVDYLDLTTALRTGAEQGGERLYYPQDGHWTVAGHRVASRAIAQWLEPQIIRDPSPAGEGVADGAPP